MSVSPARLAIHAAALFALSVSVPGHSEDRAAHQAEDWLYCGAALTSYSGFLLGRFKGDSSYGYDAEEAAAMRRDGLAFSLAGLKLHSRGANPGRAVFDALLEAANNKHQENLYSALFGMSVDAHFSKTLARCDALRATNLELFARMAARAEVEFADLIDEPRQGGGE